MTAARTARPTDLAVDTLLLHGFVGSGDDFLPLGFEALRPDWPGHGALAGLRRPEDYSLEAHLDRVDGWINAMADKSPTLVGYSMGGRLLQLALRRRGGPPPGSRIILVSTSPGLAVAAEREERRRADAAVARLLREQGMGRFLHYWHSQTMFRPLAGLPAERLEPIMRRRRAADPEGLALSLESVGPGSVPGTWDDLGALGSDVDIVVGERDPRYRELASQMAARMPSARLHVIPEAGHALHLERPELLAAVIRGGRGR